MFYDNELFKNVLVVFYLIIMSVLRIVKYFINSNIYISLIAIGMVFRVDHLFQLTLHHSIYFIVFFSTLLVYSYYGLEEKEKNTDKNIAWNISNKHLVIYVMIIGLLLLSFIFIIFPMTLILLSPAILLTTYYILPRINFRTSRFLKVYFKTIVLTFVWSYVTSIYPLLLAEKNIFSKEIISYITVETVFIYIICFLFDHRDLKSDPQRYIIFDPHKHSLLVFISAVLLLLIAIYSSWVSRVNHFYLVLKLFAVIFLVLTYRISIKSQSELWFYFILDGLLSVDTLFLILYF